MIARKSSIIYPISSIFNLNKNLLKTITFRDCEIIYWVFSLKKRSFSCLKNSKLMLCKKSPAHGVWLSGRISEYLEDFLLKQTLLYRSIWIPKEKPLYHIFNCPTSFPFPLYFQQIQFNRVRHIEKIICEI